MGNVCTCILTCRILFSSTFVYVKENIRATEYNIKNLLVGLYLRLQKHQKYCSKGLGYDKKYVNNKAQVLYITGMVCPTHMSGEFLVLVSIVR